MSAKDAVKAREQAKWPKPIEAPKPKPKSAKAIVETEGPIREFIEDMIDEALE